MEKNKWGGHKSHCCTLHGCKYRDSDCPVVTNQVKQDYLCEYCSDDGFKELEDLEEFLQLKAQVEKAKEDKTESITVSVKMLEILITDKG